MCSTQAAAEWEKKAYHGAGVEYRLHVMCVSDVCNAVFAAVQGCKLGAFESVVQCHLAFIMARCHEIMAAMKVYGVYLAIRFLQWPGYHRGYNETDGAIVPFERMWMILGS